MKIWGRTAEDVANKIIDRTSPDIHKCLVVLSGGMDSATCLYGAKAAYGDYNVEAISFNYGQKHSKELQYAHKLAEETLIPHRIFELGPLADNFKTALSFHSKDIIPDSPTKGVPPTYVPFRNTIMLSIAAGYAESFGLDRIWYGANIIDYSGYPDCRPEYVNAMNLLLKQAAPEKYIQIETPIIYLPKSEVVKLGNQFGVPWELTWSCYRGKELSCGKCPSCVYRLKGFKEAGCIDPLKYDTN